MISTHRLSKEKQADAFSMINTIVESLRSAVHAADEGDENTLKLFLQTTNHRLALLSNVLVKVAANDD